MRDRIKAIVVKEIVRTLEELAFIFAAPEEEDMDPEEGETLDVAIRFSGPFSGEIVMLYPEGDLDELAANMLGLDEDDEISVDQKLDALKETANIVCGNVLPAIGGKAAVFDIAAPRIITDPDQRPNVADAIKIQLELDEGLCFFFLNIEGDLPE